MVRTSTLFAAILATASTAFAADAVACSVSQKCPEATPCCSQYGQCGVGAYCLGGCDPLSSNKLESCVPAPVCKSGTYTFENMDRITSKSKYLGDASKTDWVMDGQALIHNKNALLTMAPDTVGTLLASSTYMWYGNVKAKFKTSRGKGVVTAFILLSDVKDEIDYEFVGVDLQTAQTNYYFQGITNYNNGANISLSDTFNNYHTYEIDWTPDQITWKIDGQVGRTKKRADTWNATTNQWAYPQTPARVQLSLWPGGLESNLKGTVDWAGGYVDWNSQDIQSNGYYYAAFESVEIKCFDADSAPGTNKGKSYTYNNAAGTNNTIVDGSKDTVLKSLQGTGTDMNKGDPALSQSSTGSKPTETAESIPGLSGAGPGTDEHSGGSSGSSGSGSGSSGSSASGTSEGAQATSTDTPSNGAFNQNSGSSGSSSGNTNSADKLGSQERILKGSVFAGIIAVVAMMAM